MAQEHSSGPGGAATVDVEGTDCFHTLKHLQTSFNAPMFESGRGFFGLLVSFSRFAFVS